MDKEALGIDLGDEAIKITLMSEAKGGPTIQTSSSILSRILFEPERCIFGLSAGRTGQRSFPLPKALLASKDLSPLTSQPSLDTEYTAESGSPGPISCKDFTKYFPGLTNYRHQTCFTLMQLTAMLLGHVRRSIEQQCGHLPHNTVLTAPYWYGSRERQKLADCVVIGGFHSIGIITDIVAVALHYGISRSDLPLKNDEESRMVAFLDIGRSGTSATVVTYSGNGMCVHQIVAEPTFGGHDIDRALFLHFTANSSKEMTTYGSKTTSLLMDRCEDLKKTLSTAQEGEIDLSLSGSAAHRVRLTQEKFQSIISDWLHRASNILLAAISASGFDPTILDAVELVGGSSQIACLKSYIQNIFAASTLTVNAGTDLSAAQGAAHACALIGSYRSDRNAILQDPSCTPFDIQWDPPSHEASNTSWVDLPHDHRLSDSDLVSMLDLELSMEESDKLAEEAEKIRHELIDYMAIISENLEGAYSDVSNPSTISLLRKSLDNAMQYVASSDSDSTNRVFYEAHLQTLHDIANPLEKVINERSKISSNQKRVELCDWGTNLIARFAQSANVEQLEEAISCLEEALNMPPAFSPELKEDISCLALAYSFRFEHSGDGADIEKAISLYQRAYQCSEGVIDLALLNNLGTILVRRFEYLGEFVDIENAVSALERAVQSTFDGQRPNPQYLTNLGCALTRRFKVYGDDEQELDRAVWLCTTAIDLSTEKDAYRIQCHMNLGMALQARFEKYGDSVDIEGAIQNCDEAVRLAPETHTSRPTCLHSLGITLLNRFNYAGNMQDIRRAISACEEAVRLANELSPNTPRFLASLGACLGACYEREGRVDDLERAMEISELAVKRTPDGRPEKYMPLHTLGNSLLHRFTNGGEQRDIDRSIDAFERVARLTKNHPDRPLCFTSLGSALTVRYEQYGDITDIDKAIRVAEKAVELLPDTHPDKVNCLNGLARSLARRFSRLSEAVDIKEAIEAGEKALSLLPENHVGKFRHMMNLGNNLSARFQKSKDPEDAHKAVLIQEKALDFLPQDHRESAILFNNLGCSLVLRFEQSGDPLWLEKVIKVFEKAIQLAPDNQANSFMYHRNLGDALTRKFKVFRNIDDINMAVSRLETALELTPVDHPDRSRCLYTLAQSLTVRYAVSGDAYDLEAAILRSSKAATSRTGSPGDRFLAAKTWVDISKKAKHNSLKDAYDCFLDLLPRVAWLGLDLERRREEIAKMGSIACDAAAAAIGMGDPQTAVTWLEKGRFIIWSQGLQLRSPIDELQALHPDLAKQLQNISVALERAVNHQVGVVEFADETVGDISRDKQKLAMRQRMLADRWDRLLVTIRKKGGFEKFLSSKSFQELSKAAHKYPVAIVNPSDSQCDILLLLTSGNVRVIPLAITYEQLQDVSDQFSTLLKQSGRTARGSVQTRAMRLVQNKVPDKWIELLEVLWIAITCPVIKALNLKPSQNPPRLSWYPTGIFSQLPLHAAGIYRDKKIGTSVHDFVISSYTPTLSLLLRLPNSCMARRTRTALAVGVSRTIIPDMIVSPLLMVSDEIRAIRDTIPAKSRVILENAQATVSNIMKAVPNCSVLHLACHAYQDQVNPLTSAFLVHGERLYLSRLIQESLSKADVAFLSACQTARGDKNTPDEAIHLAGAMLFVGFRSVIATMWSIDDDDGPVVTKAIYSSIYSESGFDGKFLATALHHIVSKMRANGAPFERWIPFISLGQC